MQLSQQSLSELPKGPFTATKLWNDMVSQMKINLQVKRRRYRMKQYDDAFVASEAVDWLHEYLKSNPNFGPTVNRHQAVQLCQKFMSHNIIEDARGKQYNSTFDDDSHIYRFVQTRYSPYKVPNSPRIAEKRRLSKRHSCDTTTSLNHTTPAKVLRRSKRFSFSRVSLTAGPSRTPLSTITNHATCTDLIKSDSKGIKSGEMRGKVNRREIEGDIIMNPAALGFGVNRHSLTEKEITDLWWSISISRLSGLLEKECLPDVYKANNYDIECVRENMDEKGICKASEIVPPWLMSAMKCLITWPNIDQGDISHSFPKYPGFERDVFRAVVEYFEGMKVPLVHPNIFPLFKMAAGVIVRSKTSAMRAVQYCCMLLQPNKRKNFQVLIKFMVKLAQNKALALSETLPTQELLIKSFSRCSFGRTGDMDVIRLLYFMMDNFPVCFMKPDGLQFQVDQRILFLQNCRGKMPTKTMTKSTTFCERVTSEEFKEEAKRSSENALKDLLDQIVADSTITEKVRSKKFKQFEKSYPDIYYARFPNNSSASRKSERLRKNFSNPLNALKNLR